MSTENPELAARVRLIAKMATAFPSMAISEETIDTYVRELFDVPMVFLQRAITQALETAKFFPTIAELREKADAMVLREYQAPAISCQKCFGTGMEIYRDDLNYNVARRCYH